MSKFGSVDDLGVMFKVFVIMRVLFSFFIVKKNINFNWNFFFYKEIYKF